MKQSLLKSFKTVLLTIALIIGAGYLLAWSGPGGIPASSNVSAPINAGTSSNSIQNRIGDLAVPGLFTTNYIYASSTFSFGLIATSGYALTSDASGYASWQPLGSGASSCPNNKILVGIDASGNILCDYATSTATTNGGIKNVNCGTGLVVTGISATGTPICSLANSSPCVYRDLEYSVGTFCWYKMYYYNSTTGYVFKRLNCTATGWTTDMGSTIYPNSSGDGARSCDLM
ncbi:MAG: hypothetical protein WCJ59_01125 [bacterium]